MIAFSNNSTYFLDQILYMAFLCIYAPHLRQIIIDVLLHSRESISRKFRMLWGEECQKTKLHMELDIPHRNPGIPRECVKARSVSSWHMVKLQIEVNILLAINNRTNISSPKPRSICNFSNALALILIEFFTMGLADQDTVPAVFSFIIKLGLLNDSRNK